MNKPTRLASKDLARDAARIDQSLPPLIAQAIRVARSALPGGHQLSMAGAGSEFWQYREARIGDPYRLIDWRRSARFDGLFVRERERQSSNSVLFWADRSRSMQFTGDGSDSSKQFRASLLVLALGILLVRGEERIGLYGGAHPPRSGTRQLENLLAELVVADPVEYGNPPLMQCPVGTHLVLLSDFLGNWEEIQRTLIALSTNATTGTIVHIFDPVEATFPFTGRVVFYNAGGTHEFETRRASAIRDDYLRRLEERKRLVSRLSRSLGWHSLFHCTNESTSAALLWLYGSLEQRA